MNKIEILDHYYNQELRKNPQSFEHLGWESREAQFERFSILTDYLNIQGKKILDVGCGLGHLLDHLKNLTLDVSYTGVDILPEMIDDAMKRHGNHEFHCSDIFDQCPFRAKSFHIIYSSGIFNLNMDNNEEFLLEAIEQFLNLSKETVVFNLLHDKSPDREDKYFYFMPNRVIKMIEERFPQVMAIELVEHYLKNDFTIILKQYRGEQCPDATCL
ncbi:MAG: class I SAM-dependent methyltransferase [Spirochaetaceae bacterium]|jgi:cyclopropane fatty-acyl-phospholipid synthase-like methyltransferase|nr:class I SAM-dependent methyltransferase [Spirochaetaceae bacterium]